MKDLVETVIGQVMRQDTAYAGKSASSPARMDAPARRVHQLNPAGGNRGAMPPDNDPLWKTSRQFEALFVEQMLSSMRKAIPDSGLLKKGFAEDVSTSMMDQAIADSIGKQGRMGMATSLYRQLSSIYPAARQVAGEQTQAIAQNGDKQGISLNGSRVKVEDPLKVEAQIAIEGGQHGTH